MANTKLLAIVAVIIVVVAGTALVVMNNDDDDKEDKRTETGRLQVYGNAFNDDVIDDYDVETLEDIIQAGSWDKTAYPFADADGNGSIEQADIDLVKKIINKESCKVRYIDGNDNVATTNYPVKKFIVGGTMVHPIIEALGASVNCIAKTGQSSSLDKVLDKLTYDLPSVGTKAWNLDLGLVSNLSETPDAVITLYSSTYDSIEEAVKSTEISCIRVDTEAGDKTLSGYLLLGTLLGFEENAAKIVAFYDKYNAIIEEKVASIAEADIKTTITTYASGMCGTSHYLCKNTISAGGKNLSDFSDSTKSCKTDVDWALADKYVSDYIVQYTQWGWGGIDDSGMTTSYDNYGKYFSTMKTYLAHNYFCVNKDLPDIVRIAYVAEYLYPTVFGEGFGDKVNQEFVDSFYSFMGDIDVSSMTWLITYDMAHKA